MIDILAPGGPVVVNRGHLLRPDIWYKVMPRFYGGNVVEDLMGNFNLTPAASAAFSPSTHVGGEGSLTMNGTTDYFSATMTNVKLLSPTTWTISVWVLGSSTFAPYFGKIGGGGGLQTWYLDDGGGTYRLIFTQGNFNQKTVSGGSTSSTVWNHIGGTYDGSALRLYINGKRQNTTTGLSGAPDGSGAGTIMIGNNSTHFINGKVDDARYYHNRVFTDSMMWELYENSKCGCPGLLMRSPRSGVSVASSTNWPVLARMAAGALSRAFASTGFTLPARAIEQSTDNALAMVAKSAIVRATEQSLGQANARQQFRANIRSVEQSSARSQVAMYRSVTAYASDKSTSNALASTAFAKTATATETTAGRAISATRLSVFARACASSPSQAVALRWISTKATASTPSTSQAAATTALATKARATEQSIAQARASQYYTSKAQQVSISSAKASAMRAFQALAQASEGAATRAKANAQFGMKADASISSNSKAATIWYATVSARSTTATSGRSAANTGILSRAQSIAISYAMAFASSRQRITTPPANTMYFYPMMNALVDDIEMETHWEYPIIYTLNADA